MQHPSVRTREHVVPFLCVVVLAMLPACSSGPVPQTRPRPSLWVVQSRWVSALDLLDKVPVDQTLRSDASVFLGYGPGVNGGGPLPATSWAWPSYASFREQLRDPGQAPFFDNIRLVMYDPEAWSATPIDEQRLPVLYMQRFARLAKRHGWQVLLTPNPDLMTVTGGACVARTGESMIAAYARCDIAGSAAKAADIVETQAQAFESNPAAYRSFVQSTASQARLANPQVHVIAGLSTEQGAAAMYTGWNSVRDVVDGYYLSIGKNPPRVGVALRFLRMVAAPTASGPST